MADFFGWDMPIEYKGIIAEHKNTRTNVSLFDVSHMGEFTVEGKNAEAFLNYVTANNLSKIKPGQAQYNAMLYESGGVVDDIIGYKNHAESFLLCVNSANIEKDFSHLASYAKAFDVTLANISDEVALIAVQGKYAKNIVRALSVGNTDEILYYHFIKTTISDRPVSVSRVGYTGEDGFEIACRSEHAAEIWQLLMQRGTEYNIAPAGLGARDTLRLEACFPLYGNDLDDRHNPFESNLGWIVKMNKDDFVGKTALEAYRSSDSPKIKLLPFKVIGRGIPRNGHDIFKIDGEKIASVSSGGYSPILQYGIGMGYFPAGSVVGDQFELHAHKKNVRIEIQSPPFVKINK